MNGRSTEQHLIVYYDQSVFFVEIIHYTGITDRGERFKSAEQYQQLSVQRKRISDYKVNFFVCWCIIPRRPL